MASSLELRAPFLDVDLASFCISLPPSMKIDQERDKILLRNVFEGELPDDILNRKKQGFGAPVDKWLELESVKELRHKHLEDPNDKMFQFLPFDKVQEFNQASNQKTWILLFRCELDHDVLVPWPCGYWLFYQTNPHHSH